MRKRTFLTALITVVAIGTGSAAALSIGGISLPTPPVHFSAKSLFAAKTPPPSGASPSAAQSAAAFVYGSEGSLVTIDCNPAVGRGAGAMTLCHVLVVGLVTRPTGTITFTSSNTGSFSVNPCTLTPFGVVTSQCYTTYTGAVVGLHLITAHYSGDATYAPNTNPAPVPGIFTVRNLR